jgi:hypothetical protein
VPSDEPTITEKDVSELNRAAVDRTAAFARIGGAVLVAVGAVGLPGWIWIATRAQQQAAVGTIAFVGNTSGSATLLPRWRTSNSTMTFDPRRSIHGALTRRTGWPWTGVRTTQRAGFLSCGVVGVVAIVSG